MKTGKEGVGEKDLELSNNGDEFEKQRQREAETERVTQAEVK